MKILILCAFKEELNFFINSFSNLEALEFGKRKCLLLRRDKDEIFISSCGIGTTNAACTTTALCETLSPDLILVCGTAGGLCAGQKTGDLILADSIIDLDLYHLPDIIKGTPFEITLNNPHTEKNLEIEYLVDTTLLLNILKIIKLPNIKIGRIVTSNTFPLPKEMHELIKKLNCIAIEMESSAIFNAAQYYNIPVITLRAISNVIDADGNDRGTADHAIEKCSKQLGKFLIKFIENLPLITVYLNGLQGRNN